MDNLQLINLEDTEIVHWDFEQLRSILHQRLSQYSSIIYTDDTIASAKDDRAMLAKVKKVFDDARKTYKAQCLAPYEAIEPEVKELIDMVEQQRSLIDEAVKEYEARQKVIKEQEIRKYYDRKAVALGNLADALYLKIFDKKWINASTQRKKYEEAIQVAINQACADLEVIRAMHSVFEATLIQTYAATLSVQAAMDKDAELHADLQRAGLSIQSNTVAAPAPTTKEQLPDANDGTTMKVYASQTQMTTLCDFMKAIGVRYEFI